MLDRSTPPLASEIARQQLPEASRLMLGNIEANILNQGTQPVILLEMVIPVGRWQEDISGLTYYVYKLLAEGTINKTSEEIASAFDFMGAHLEITPTLDHISIKLYVLNKFLESALGVFAEVISQPSFPEEEFEILKQIRFQQVEQQFARNNAYANLKFREMLFGENHPYGLMITPESSQQVTLSDINNFKSNLLYKPLLFVTGMVSDKEVKLIENAFNKLALTEGLTLKNVAVNQTKEAKITREDSTQASIRMGHITIDRKHPDIHKLKVTNTLFGGFFGSRLMKNIREEKGLTYGIHSSLIHLDQASYWSISSELLRDKTELGISEIHKELDKLKTEVPGDREFMMVKNYMKGKFLSSFDTPFNSHEVIKSLRLANLTNNNLHAFLDNLDQMEAKEVNVIAQQYFDNDALSTLIVY